LIFLYMYFIQHCFICRLSDSTVSEDGGIEPRTVATSIVSNVNRLVSEPTFIEIGEFRRHLLVLGNLHKNRDIYLK
jgi:hypothetical protein